VEPPTTSPTRGGESATSPRTTGGGFGATSPFTTNPGSPDPSAAPDERGKLAAADERALPLILLFINIEISSIKMCLDIFILAKSIMDRREYYIFSIHELWTKRYTEYHCSVPVISIDSIPSERVFFDIC
jgi:hypothetical protein